MTLEEAGKHNDYLHALALESARERVREFRERIGWDREEIGGPAPLQLLAEILYEMHRTAEKVSPYLPDITVSQTVAIKELSRWLLPVVPEPKTEPFYDFAVQYAAENLLNSKLTPGFTFTEVASALQNVFDAGREAGTHQEVTERPTFDLSRYGYDPLEQCRKCGIAVYPDQNHECLSTLNQARSFRSFGDRRP